MTKTEFEKMLTADERLTESERLTLIELFDRTAFNQNDDDAIDVRINFLSDDAISYLAYLPHLIQYLQNHLPNDRQLTDLAIVDGSDADLLLKIFQQIQNDDRFDDGKHDVDLHGYCFTDDGSIIVESASSLNELADIQSNENLDRLISYGSIAVQRLLFEQRHNEIDDVYFKYIGSIYTAERYFTVITYADIVAILTAFVKNDVVKGPNDAEKSFETETKGIVDNNY